MSQWRKLCLLLVPWCPSSLPWDPIFSARASIEQTRPSQSTQLTTQKRLQVLRAGKHHIIHPTHVVLQGLLGVTCRLSLPLEGHDVPHI